MKTDLPQIAEELKKYKTFALFIHIRPDGDAVGSALGLKSALRAIGKKADIFCADEVPEKFYFLAGADEISRSFCGGYEAHVALDCSDEARLGELSGAFAKAKTTFGIDHHVSNTRYAKFNYVGDKASNCESAFALIGLLGVTPDAEAATALLTGVVTDSGNFSHGNTTAETLSAAAALKALGGDIEKINYKMFKEQSPARAKLFGMTACGVRYFENGRIGLMTVTKKALGESGARPDETEGFIDFLMGVNTVEVGMCMMEMADKTYKVSFRSKKADVNAVAGTFGGGGHVLASGCMIRGYYEDAVDRLVYACRQHMEDLP